MNVNEELSVIAAELNGTPAEESTVIEGEAVEVVDALPDGEEIGAGTEDIKQDGETIAVEASDEGEVKNLSQLAEAIEVDNEFLYGIEIPMGDGQEPIALGELNRAQDALHAFNQAISYDPHYFRPILRRGLLRYELKSFSDAKQDFKTSLTLAPTQIAYLKLGEIAENQQNCSAAKQYYQQAAKAGDKHQQALQNKLSALQLSCP